jgi:diacylglycerol kinase
MNKNDPSDTEKLKPHWRSADRSPLVRIMKSFVYAGRGVVDTVRSQTNAWVHLLATTAVVLSGLWFGLSPTEWCLAILAMGLVWGLEGLNTALERLADALHPAEHPLIGKAKDAASGAVLLGAIAAAAVGLIIYLPRFIALL